MTHDELCARAARWLKKTRGCRLVLREVVSYAGERPDAMGWQASTGWSLLVECKVSRSDFLRDRKKSSRGSHWSMGQFRFYMTPPGLLTLEDLPEGWGLLEAHPRSVRVVRDVKIARSLDPLGYRGELMHMMRGIRMANGEDTIPTRKSTAIVGLEAPDDQDRDRAENGPRDRRLPAANGDRRGLVAANGVDVGIRGEGKNIDP